jgi:tetratricopeptide (TPR) repeat protein
MDRSQPISIASPNSDGPRPEGTLEMGGSEGLELKEQVRQGDLTGLRQYLVRTHKECDWQDRVFMLSLITPSVRLAALDFACDTEPKAADLFLIRCSYYSELAGTMRGGGTGDQVSRNRFRNAAECIQAAMADLDRATRLDAQDPTAYACVLPSLTIFGQLLRHQEWAFLEALKLAPELVAAHHAIVITLSKRWHGSNEESLQFARHAMTKTGSGSDMAACLFRAHMLAQSHPIHFDQNPKEAERYLHDPEVTRELNDAFDQWTQPLYVPRRSSIPYLHYAAYWYYLCEDVARLQRALSLTGNTFSEAPWSWIGNPRKVYARAVQIAAGKTPPPLSAEPEPWEDSVAVVDHGVKAMNTGKLADAEKAFLVAFGLAKTAPQEAALTMIPLILLCRSLLRLKQGKLEESTTLRADAVALLEAHPEQIAPTQVQRPLAIALHNAGEHRLAVRYLEQAIGPAEEETDPFIMADMLHKLGSSYNQMGLMDYSAVPLRAALKIYEDTPEDPRVPGILLALGNSLRKSSPGEAEALYKKAAELRVARLQLESACPAWTNLGVLCSEQGRHAESLECYERVLRVREQSPGTPPDRIASVLNNMANCYRRMGNFAKAHGAVDRALKLLSPKDGATLPSVYGTKGMIHLDAGEDKQAVEWIRKALAGREKQSSPNLDATVENLESEIAALNRLGRKNEAVAAETRLASVRATMQSIHQVGGDLGAIKNQEVGAVFVELPFGNRAVGSEGRRSLSFLANMLSEEVRAQDAGYYGGRIALPESTTLFFYGPDAERLLQILEPSLRKERVCAGARVLVRQGPAQREIVMARQATTVN